MCQISCIGLTLWYRKYHRRDDGRPMNVLTATRKSPFEIAPSQPLHYQGRYGRRDPSPPRTRPLPAPASWASHGNANLVPGVSASRPVSVWGWHHPGYSPPCRSRRLYCDLTGNVFTSIVKSMFSIRFRILLCQFSASFAREPTQSSISRDNNQNGHRNIHS